jgi:hypothetical protein
MYGVVVARPPSSKSSEASLKKLPPWLHRQHGVCIAVDSSSSRKRGYHPERESASVHSMGKVGQEGPLRVSITYYDLDQKVLYIAACLYKSRSFWP